MIIDQKMDVRDVRLARDLVEKTPARMAALTASIRRQGFSRTRRFIRHLRQQPTKCKLSHSECVRRNAGTTISS